MHPVRSLLSLLVVTALLRAQAADIYQRVRQTLGEAAVAELRANHFSKLEAQLAALPSANAKDRAEILSLKGALEFLDGKMGQAVADFRESEKLHPAQEADRFTLSMALVRLGDEEQARAVLSSLATEHPNAAIYWYWLGRIDYYQRRYTESVANLEKAVTLDPKTARAWDSLGLAWDMQGRMEQAREDFEKAVSLNRSQTQPSPWPPHNLGYLLLRIGEIEKSEQALRESLRYDSKVPRTHYYLARTLEKENRESEAVAEYQLAVAGDPTSADACYSLAMLYRKMHRDAEATAMFAEFKKRKGGEVSPSR